MLSTLISEETSKVNSIDFYQYLVKLLVELLNLSVHQWPNIRHKENLQERLLESIYPVWDR